MELTDAIIGLGVTLLRVGSGFALLILSAVPTNNVEDRPERAAYLIRFLTASIGVIVLSAALVFIIKHDEFSMGWKLFILESAVMITTAFMVMYYAAVKSLGGRWVGFEVTAYTDMQVFKRRLIAGLVFLASFASDIGEFFELFTREIG